GKKNIFSDLMRLHFRLNLQETRKWALNHKFPARKSSLITTKERLEQETTPNLIPLTCVNPTLPVLIRCPEGQRLCVHQREGKEPSLLSTQLILIIRLRLRFWQLTIERKWEEHSFVYFYLINHNCSLEIHL
ncbi:hypothetical protein CEXT_404211, partial [Caerostris extrusa]